LHQILLGANGRRGEEPATVDVLNAFKFAGNVAIVAGASRRAVSKTALVDTARRTPDQFRTVIDRDDQRSRWPGARTVRRAGQPDRPGKS
jgi:hypothetical protein